MKKLIVGITAGGSVVLIDGQLKYFRERGYKTYLLGPPGERVSEFCRKEGCTHLSVNINRDITPVRDFLVLLRIIFLFCRYRPSVINLGTPKVSLLGMIAGKILRIKKRIYTCRGFRFEHEKGIKKRILILMERITSKCAHKIICISPSLRDFGVNHKIFEPGKTIVINKGSSNGINLGKFSPGSVSKELKNKLKNELGIENKFVFGFVGRIYDRKGINELYEAFTRLSDIFSEIVLLIVGRVEETQIVDNNIIDLLKSHKNIRMTGPQKNVPLYLSLMDVFVLPSWGEGFGNVMIEAAAMGVPVIGTDTTGIRDSMLHNFNGIMVAPNSADLLENAMLQLYKNVEMRKKFAKNGLNWAANFGNHVIWRGIEEIYN